MKNKIIKPLESQYNPSVIEEEIIKYWKENNTFEKSVSQRDSKDTYRFYDGPPFVTGKPHYGHLLSSIIKDVIPRFQTMKGKHVDRVWGWDCHGLPIENKVEQLLGVNSKKEIETLGIGKFVSSCKTYVQDVSSEWEWYIDRIGRWVDMDHSYRTMDKNYMESVIWVFKQLYDKGNIYKSLCSVLDVSRPSVISKSPWTTLTKTSPTLPFISSSKSKAKINTFLHGLPPRGLFPATSP
jgi:isoleucyl-tRNA synthetase